MESQWFKLDENDDDLDNMTSPFMGIFIKRPEEIARSIPRPITPFADIHENLPINVTVHSKDIFEDVDSRNFESPVISRRESKSQINPIPLITVF